MPIPKYRNNLKFCRLQKHLSQKDLVQRSQEYLFSFESNYRQNLNHREVPGNWQDIFRCKGYTLSKNAAMKKKEGVWGIYDKYPKYIVKRGEENTFYVYDAGVTEITVARLDRIDILNPHFRTMQKLAKALGEDVDKVFPPVKSW